MLKILYKDLISILSNGYLLYQYLILWFIVNPDLIVVKTLSVFIVCEFIMVHSGVFMAVFQKQLSIIFFILIYGLFVYQFNKMLPLRDNQLMIAYFIIVLNRMRFAFYNVSKKELDRLLGFSGLGAVLYIFSIGFCAIFSNHLPKLNYTNDFLNKNAFHNIDGFSNETTTLIATGTLYYFLLVFFTIYNAYLERKLEVI